MLNPYLLFGKQDREGATSLDAYIVPGERVNEQVHKPTDCGKHYQSDRDQVTRGSSATSDVVWIHSLFKLKQDEEPSTIRAKEKVQAEFWFT